MHPRAAGINVTLAEGAALPGVVRHYQAHLDRRRQARPADEYRP